MIKRKTLRCSFPFGHFLLACRTSNATENATTAGHPRETTATSVNDCNKSDHSVTLTFGGNEHFDAFSSRHVPPDPAPPRAVIIERLPPLPPKPRDIVIERWLPYEIVNQKRKVIVERAQKTSKDHPQPKNIIIT